MIESLGLGVRRIVAPGRPCAHPIDHQGRAVVRGTETRGFLCYLGCALALALIAACSGSTGPGTPEPTAEAPEPTDQPGATPTPGPPVFNFQAAFAGTYSVNATKTQDTGCNFRPSFNGQIVITVNPDGSNFVLRVVEQATRTHQGNIQQNGNFNASGTNSFSGFTENGQVNGNNINATETLNFTAGPPNCVNQRVVYQYSGSR
jgi:hypothetical protein